MRQAGGQLLPCPPPSLTVHLFRWDFKQLGASWQWFEEISSGEIFGDFRSLGWGFLDIKSFLCSSFGCNFYKLI
jgi:hypothetical protein